MQQAATMGQSWVLRNSGNLPFRQWVTVPETGSSEAALPPITIVPTSDGGMTIFTDQGSQHITPTPAPATAETPAPVVETSLLATMNLADGRSLSFVIAEVDDSIQSTAIVVGPDNIAVVTVDVAPTADEGQAVVGITVTVDGNVVSKTFDIVTITLPNPQPPPAIPDEDVIDLETPLPPTEESPVPDVAPVPAENTPETSVTPDTPGTPDDSSTVDSTDSSNADSTTSSDSDAASADSSSTSTDGSVGGDGSGAAGDGSASGDGGSAAGDGSAGGDGGSAGGVA